MAILDLITHSFRHILPASQLLPNGTSGVESLGAHRAQAAHGGSYRVAIGIWSSVSQSASLSLFQMPSM